MRRRLNALTLSILLGAVPAAAQVDPLRGSPEAADADAPAKPAVLNWRATQVNRCANLQGGVALQDTPCRPVTADAPGAASSTVADVLELSSMPPRPRASAPQAPLQDTTTRSALKGLLNGSWKLALLVLACYVALRVVRTMHDSYRFRRSASDSPRAK